VNPSTTFINQPLFAEYMAKVRKKKKAKVIKKKWVKLYAPKLFNNQLLGKTHVADNKLALGKVVTTNLMNLTRDPKKQNVYVSFQVTGLKEEGAETFFFRYQLSKAVIKRYVRRNRTKVGDSIEVKTLDNKKLKVKPLIVTRFKISKPTQTDVRKKARNYLLYKFSKMSMEQVANDLVSKKSLFRQIRYPHPIHPQSPAGGCRWIRE